MNSEQKKEFALRISQANNVEMIIIAYEMVSAYIEDALAAGEDFAKYEANTELAGKCVDELMANLHYEYEPAVVLKNLYLYMKTRIRDARYNRDYEALEEVNTYIKQLKAAYESVKEQDTSGPIMKNTQTVVTGITYGKNQILDELSSNVDNRGFLV